MKIINKILSSLIIVLACISVLNINSKAMSASEYLKDYKEADTEFRAVWVCSVDNMDVEKQKGTSESAINEWKEQYLEIINNALEFNLNTIIFQVRPNNDAFYPSKYNPWSEYLVGFGVDPGWDPLKWMIEVTHEAGLEYHAWLNPYRTSCDRLSFSIKDSSNHIYDYDDKELQDYKKDYYGKRRAICEKNGTLVDNPIFKTGSDLEYDVVLGAEEKFVLNPASVDTINLLNNTITELVENYELDGIHFDDYFYPSAGTYYGSNANYKKYVVYSTEPKIDVLDYNKYLSTVSGEPLSIHDWRRNNVSTLIKNLSDIIREKNKTKEVHKCAFGISPAAGYAPIPESCSASDQHRTVENGMHDSCYNYYSYSDLYADTYMWAKEEWIDYIVPQCYTQSGFNSVTGLFNGRYTAYVSWWSDALKDSNCKLYIGTPIYQVKTWTAAGSATTMEIPLQIVHNYKKNYNVDGYVLFRYVNLIDKLKDSSSLEYKVVTANCWKKTALTPLYPAYTYSNKATCGKISEIEYFPDDSYTIHIEKGTNVKAYAIKEDGVIIDRVLAGQTEVHFNTLDRSKHYTLVTYGFDNTQLEEETLIDLNSIKENQKPVISLNTQLEKKYLLPTTLNLSFTVTDNENDELSYEVECDGMPYAKGKVENNTVDCSIMLMASSNEQKIKITVKDLFGESIFESSAFMVFDNIEDYDNYGEDPNPPTPPEPAKTGCNSGIRLIVVLISVVTMIYILRKKNY